MALGRVAEPLCIRSLPPRLPVDTSCLMKIPPWFFLCYFLSVGPGSLLHAAQPDFGPNVTIFDPSMPAGDIQAALNQTLQEQVGNQFGSQRYAFLFKPGQYSVDAQLGYYTSVAGLGLSPDDVTINGQVRVEGQLLDGRISALVNFWRSAENLAVNPIAPLITVARRSTSGQCRRPLRCGGSISEERSSCSPTLTGSPAAASSPTRLSAAAVPRTSTVSSSTAHSSNG
jgi:hypothetical protein